MTVKEWHALRRECKARGIVYDKTDGQPVLQAKLDAPVVVEMQVIPDDILRKFRILRRENTPLSISLKKYVEGLLEQINGRPPDS